MLPWSGGMRLPARTALGPYVGHQGVADDLQAGFSRLLALIADDEVILAFAILALSTLEWVVLGFGFLS